MERGYAGPESGFALGYVNAGVEGVQRWEVWSWCLLWIWGVQATRCWKLEDEVLFPLSV